MCSMQHCEQYIGQWVRFHTPLGSHRGVVEQVANNAALIRVPRQYAPVGYASDRSLPTQSLEQKIDAVLAGGYGYAAPGPGYPPAYGNGWWAGGWWYWWIPFLAILALAFLW